MMGTIKRILALSVFVFIAVLPLRAGVDFFGGQVSGTVGYRDNDGGKGEIGLRYIPEMRISKELAGPGDGSMDTEIALKAVFESTGTYRNPNLDLYRFSARYFTPVFEARLGLQKIAFGPARILRSLMWFDSIDPRDPFGITAGVAGMLLRYYPENNSNFWTWVLLPGSGAKGLEAIKTDKHHLEMGSRAQVPFKKGEVGVTVNARYVDPSDWTAKMGSVLTDGREMRIALDGSWDPGIGVWFESVLNKMNITASDNIYTGFFTLGGDYTFKNGVLITLEHMVNASGLEIGDMRVEGSSTALLASYALSILDSVNAIFYYDWTGEKAYLFSGYQRTLDDWKFNLMVYSSEESPSSTFSGRGLRFMVTYNY